MSVYVTLKEISSKETLTDTVFKAKLEGDDGFADITITVKVKTKEDLTRTIPIL